MKALTGVRLGRHERRLLLAAAVPDAKDGDLVDALTESRAEQSAVSRAARKLEEVGLARLGQKKIRAEKPHPLYRGTVQRSTVVRRVAWLTPLGAAIVDRYRVRLEASKPIRWGAHAAECVEAATQETPQW